MSEKRSHGNQHAQAGGGSGIQEHNHCIGTDVGCHADIHIGQRKQERQAHFGIQGVSREHLKQVEFAGAPEVEIGVEEVEESTEMERPLGKPTMLWTRFFHLFGGPVPVPERFPAPVRRRPHRACAVGRVHRRG